MQELSPKALARTDLSDMWRKQISTLGTIKSKSEVTEIKCCGCKRVKPVKDFSPDHTRSTGYRSECRECVNKRRRAWRKSK